MPINSKKKGDDNQAEVAKALSAWWGETFKATPKSGGLRWKGAFWTYGDISPPESFLGCIECKHYIKVSSDTVLRLGPNSYILYWWSHQVSRDAKRAQQELKLNIHPFLVYKQNQCKHHIVFDLEFFLGCLKAGGYDQHDVKHLLIFYPPHRPLANMLLSEFFEQFSKEQVLEAMSQSPTYS
jgi:hypothetical protein